MTNLDMKNMPDHHPERDSQVEAWLIHRRDQFPMQTEAYRVLNNMVVEYQTAADNMHSLEEVVNEQLYREEEEERAKKRPAKKKAKKS